MEFQEPAQSDVTPPLAKTPATRPRIPSLKTCTEDDVELVNEPMKDSSTSERLVSPLASVFLHPHRERDDFSGYHHAERLVFLGSSVCVMGVWFQFALDGKLNEKWSRGLDAGARLAIQAALRCCGYYNPSS